MANTGHDTPTGAGSATTAAPGEFTPEYERKVATWLISGIVVALVLVALAVWAFGLPALGIAGLVATVLVFFMLLSYAAGW